MIMMKTYSIPRTSILDMEMSSILSSSIRNERSTIPKTTAPSVVAEYSSLTRRQKLAALNLMFCFGCSSCSNNFEHVPKVDHILVSECKRMGILKSELTASTNMFSDMPDMVDNLRGVDEVALEKIFIAIYCIIAIGKSEEAVRALLAIYEQLGFSEQDCLSILEKSTGVKVSE